MHEGAQPGTLFDSCDPGPGGAASNPPAHPSGAPAEREARVQPDMNGRQIEGFYHELLKAIEPVYTSMIDSVSLEDEIRMLRVLMRSVLKLSMEIEDLVLAIKVLNALGSASQRIMNLQKTQHSLAQEQGSVVNQALEEALMQIKEKYNL